MVRVNIQPITVVKLGGRTQNDPALPAALTALWHRTHGRLVVVHGGGDQISALQRLRGEEPVFVGGRRVTTPLALELVRMVLSGSANKQLVAMLTVAGAPAVGISGEDAAMLPATLLDASTYGSVGAPASVQPKLIEQLLAGGFLPVISPVGTNLNDEAHGALNVNGDDAAAAIAIALKAAELLLMVDVAGVLDAHKLLIPKLTLAHARALVAGGVADGGMAAKLEACGAALNGGVARVRVGNLAALHAADVGTHVGTHVGTDAGTVITFTDCPSSS
jgi:acetylglutamate kinase